MKRINMCGNEDILKSEAICVPIDIDGNLLVEIDVPIWMKERLFNMSGLNMLEPGKTVSLFGEDKDYVFMVIKRHLDYCLLSDIELSIYSLKKIKHFKSISVPFFKIKNVNEMSIVAWYNNAIDHNTEMNMYPCPL